MPLDAVGRAKPLPSARPSKLVPPRSPTRPIILRWSGTAAALLDEPSSRLSPPDLPQYRSSSCTSFWYRFWGRPCGLQLEPSSQLEDTARVFREPASWERQSFPSKLSERHEVFVELTSFAIIGGGGCALTSFEFEFIISR